MYRLIAEGWPCCTSDVGKFSISLVLEKMSYLMILTSGGCKLGDIGELIQRPTNSSCMKFF